MVSGAMPLVEGVEAFVRGGAIEKLEDAKSLSYGAEQERQNNGVCRVRTGGRYHQFQVRILEGDHDGASGLELETLPLGIR